MSLKQIRQQVIDYLQGKRANVKDDSAEQILANMQIITDVLKNPVPNRKIEDLEGDEESEQTGTTE